jgi:hypothetical protein
MNRTRKKFTRKQLDEFERICNRDWRKLIRDWRKLKKYDVLNMILYRHAWYYGFMAGFKSRK